MADWLKDFMGRTPFAILGAIGLLSMASQFINLADDIENWLKVWKAVTRPVWEWIAGLVGFELPNWLKDYLTVGVIHGGMTFRMTRAVNEDDLGFQSGSFRAELNWYPTELNWYPTELNDRTRSLPRWFLPVVFSIFLWPVALNMISWFLIEARKDATHFWTRIDPETIASQHQLEALLNENEDLKKSWEADQALSKRLKKMITIYVETVIWFMIGIAISGALVLLG